jgi:hypothetical protein
MVGYHSRLLHFYSCTCTFNQRKLVLKVQSQPDGYLFIKDLRRSWLGLFESEIKSAFSLDEAQKLIEQS